MKEISAHLKTLMELISIVQNHSMVVAEQEVVVVEILLQVVMVIQIAILLP